MTRTVTSAAALLAALALSTPALAWDAAGHRTVAWLALDCLPADAPAFLKEPAVRESVTWNAAEPDRWRGEKNPFLMNGTYMDHFMDVEDLEQFGLTLDTIPMLRYRFVREVTLARAKWPAGKDGSLRPYDEKKDAAGQQEFPGFVPYAICEQQARLMNQFRTWRILRKLNDPSRGEQVKMAEANILSTMGVLAHVAGDTAQPLHTTKHYNGWAADAPNPEGFTKDKGFHAVIDGGLIREFTITYDDCRAVRDGAGGSGGASKDADKAMNPKDAASSWKFTIDYLKRSNAKVTPLYRMEKSGSLHGPAGRSFIIDCLNEGGAALGAYYASAWAASEPTDKEVADFVKYDGWTGGGKRKPGGEAAPALPAPGAKPAAEPSAPAPAPAKSTP